jgi:outer membrane lipoprotein-sorting protein
MRRFCLPALLGLAAVASTAGAQVPPTAGTVINRISGTYRSMKSYRDTATLTRKLGSKDATATVNLAAERPNRYLLEVKGDMVNTVVFSDGTSLVAYRPDRKVYTKTKAPALLMKANVLGTVDLPSPGARIITALLQNTLRDGDTPLAKSIMQAQLTANQPFGGGFAHILTFPYDADYSAKLYVTADDNIIRRITLLREGATEVVENHTNIEVDKPIPSDTFTQKLPEGTQLVLNLPPLPSPTEVAGGPPAPDFVIETTNGDRVKLSDYKGKVVLLNFFFNN